ncbi:hypothetical protein M378DRAFT_805557 [Amanita muscaria Koide BX008]|uniref:Uncharacterized protein n=1 Tax=Amanita muscaria (strain Koide BX008) TaxID=946122 RepID=A0A0C2WKQ6_AMAMK|nr:hypothetical protein M378DRAFT_805557 [Amanita muscaria Koide BX008]
MRYYVEEVVDSVVKFWRRDSRSRTNIRKLRTRHAVLFFPVKIVVVLHDLEHIASVVVEFTFFYCTKSRMLKHRGQWICSRSCGFGIHATWTWADLGGTFQAPANCACGYAISHGVRNKRRNDRLKHDRVERK